MVAVVRNIGSQATNVMIGLEDGTGHCEARLWLDTTSDQEGQMAGIE